jgi:MYXO-CTERM domain-containing protein
MRRLPLLIGVGAAGLACVAAPPLAVEALARADLSQGRFTFWAWVIGVLGVALCLAVGLFLTEDPGEADRYSAVGLVLAAAVPLMLGTGPAAREAGTWHWVTATVLAVECHREPGDDGCDERYHLTNPDLGALTCSDARLRAGDPARVHVSPSGRRMKLEACAARSGGYAWTYRGLLALYVLGAAVVIRRTIRLTST